MTMVSSFSHSFDKYLLTLLMCHMLEKVLGKQRSTQQSRSFPSIYKKDSQTNRPLCNYNL